MINSVTSNVSFGGLKDNLRTGEVVYRNFRKEYPYLKSDTFLQMKIMENEGLDRFQQLKPKLKRLASKYERGVDVVRTQLAANYRSFDSYIDKLKTVLVKNRYLNCREQGHLTQYELLKKGEKPHFIEMWVKNAQYGGNIEFGEHGFTVFGLKKGAKLHEPKTWGGSAVVVDPWSGSVLPAREALALFKTKLGFNSTKHNITYMPKNLVKVE